MQGLLKGGEGGTKGVERKALARIREEQTLGNRGIRGSSGWLSINKLLDTVLAWPCSVPHECYLNKHHFRAHLNLLFLCERLSACV